MPSATPAMSRTTRPFLSVKAEPLPEDDFERDARADATGYAAVQKHGSERDVIKESNKERRRKGLPPIALPKRASRREDTNRKRRKPPAEAESEGDASDSNDDDLDLGYEGQVILPFNPLERLAGLTQGTGHAQFLAQLAASSSSTAATSATAVADEVAPEEEFDETDWATGAARLDTGGGPVGEAPEEVFSDIPQPVALAVDARRQEPAADARPAFTFTSQQGQIPALPLDASTPDVAIPASINRFLRDYQRAGARFLYANYIQGRGAILGDDMGLGKTVQVLAFLSAIMRKTGTSVDENRRKIAMRSNTTAISPERWPTVLIVSPLSLVTNWMREIDTWGYFEYRHLTTTTAQDVISLLRGGYLDIVLASYETVVRTVDLLKSSPISVIIADEAHVLKDWRAKKTLAMKALKARAAFALSGTVVANRLDELWSICDFVHRGWAGTLRQWRAFAVNPIKKGHRHNSSVQEVTLSLWKLGLLHDRVMPHFYLRRDKRLIADELPEKRDQVVFCPLGERQLEAYQRLVDSPDVEFILRRNEVCDCGSTQGRGQCHYATNADGEGVGEAMLKNMGARRKVANHLGLLYHAKDDSPRTIEINKKIFRICMGKEYDARLQLKDAFDPANCGKWKILERLLLEWRTDSAAANKVLVFSNSVRLLKMIAEFIAMSDQLSGFDYDLLSGEVQQGERMSMVDRFQDVKLDHFILLVSAQAGGVGLNITAANKVVIFDPSWNPAIDLQSMDRAYRIGAKRAVDIFRLVARGTLEELVYERQIHKQQRAHQLNTGAFERRLHVGYDGARTAADQGELFGIANMFRFEPGGFVHQNLERARLAEMQFAQDLVEAEYEGDEGGDESGDDAAFRKVRKSRALHKIQAGDDQSLVQEMLGRSKKRTETDILASLGVTPHLHENAFADSPEERRLYEIGKTILASHPQWANTKANEAGKIRLPRSSTSPAKRGRLSTARDERDEAEPWRERVLAGRARSSGKRLADLSD